MTLGEHLDELRTRLIRSVVALLAVFLAAWFFHEELTGVIEYPLRRAVSALNVDLVAICEERLEADPDLSRERYFLRDVPPEAAPENRLVDPIPGSLRGDGAGSALFFYLRVCSYFAIFGAGPFILWQLWQFIAAGLYAHEKKAARVYFPVSLALFLGGVLFGFFVLVPYGQYFLARFGLEQIRYDPKIEDYFRFIRSLCLALGVVFQLPLLMLASARLGLIEPPFFAKYRGEFVLVALIVAAFMTPPDPVTQLLMAGPMVVLYEVGILLARTAHRRRAQEGDEPP